jgi:hypothetical protein
MTLTPAAKKGREGRIPPTVSPPRPDVRQAGAGSDRAARARRAARRRAAAM